MKQQQDLADKQHTTFVGINAAITVDIKAGQVIVQVLDDKGQLVFIIPRSPDYLLTINGQPYSPLLKGV